MATNIINSNIASHTRSKIKKSLIIQESNQKFLIDHITQLWNKLNDALEYAPDYQNKNQAGVDEETIQQVESKLNITLPAEIRAVIKVHDGRDHIRFGVYRRLATTDLLPIAQWRPYEKEPYGYPDILFECLSYTNTNQVDENLYDDVQDHLTVYMYGKKEADELSNRKKRRMKYNMAKDKTFHALPCELLVIGEGMDDYAEQYLLSIRSGRIYLAVQNIPKWELIGTFADWIHLGTHIAEVNKDYIKEEHDDYHY